MEHCGCGGRWIGTVSKKEVEWKLGVLGNVAEFHGLRMLGGVLEGVKKRGL